VDNHPLNIKGYPTIKKIGYTPKKLRDTHMMWIKQNHPHGVVLVFL